MIDFKGKKQGKYQRPATRTRTRYGYGYTLTRHGYGYGPGRHYKMYTGTGTGRVEESRAWVRAGYQNLYARRPLIPGDIIVTLAKIHLIIANGWYLVTK